MKILYFIHRKTYNRKMSRVRFHGLGAIKRYPGNDLKITGPGFPDFDGARNVERRFKPDLVMWYKPLSIPGYMNVKSPKCLRFNECWDKKWTAQEIQESKSKLVLMHHYNDIARYNKILSPKFNLVHNPHCGEVKIFKDYGLEKDIDVLHIGVLSKKFYPLRVKFVREVQPILKAKGYTFQQFKHPGYKMKNLKQINKHTEKYARAISRAKIVVTDMSIYNYALAKVVEVPLCKTALCSNLPDENPKWFERWMIGVNKSDSPQVIADKLISYLSAPEELLRKTKAGYSENMEMRKQEDYAIRFQKLATEFVNGSMESYDFRKDSDIYYNAGERVYY